MKVVEISNNECNYLKDDGSYLLSEHVQWCAEFSEGFGNVVYNDYKENFVNEEGKNLLKNNVDDCWSFKEVFLKNNVEDSLNFENVFAHVEINDIWYYIDKECNFYNENKVSFKELYKLYPNMRSLLIEIIDKYTYFDVEEYFV